MLRSIVWYLEFVISLILKTPKLIRVKKLEGKVPKEEILRQINIIARKWCKPKIKLSGARIKIDGEYNIPDETVLFVSNHQSDFDIAIFMSEIKKDKGYVAKSEMLKVPLLREWMRYLQCIFVDRNDMKQSGKALLDGIKYLKEGYSMVLFPEGTRSKSSKMGEFKKTSFKLATKSKVPIVPVSISGTYRLLEGSHYIITPSDVYIKIHPPVETKNLTKEEQENLPTKIEEIIKGGIKTDM